MKNMIRPSKFIVLIPALVMGLVCSHSSAEIYKITNADGSVMYSDRIPNTIDNTVQRLFLPEIPSTPYNIPNTNTTDHAAIHSGSQTGVQQNNGDVTSKTATKKVRKVKTQSPNYTMEMISPIKARAYRKPLQSVEIAVKVKPKLLAGDKVVISVDGNHITTGLAVSVPTSNLHLGEHTIKAGIVSNGKVVNVITMPFYVIQHTNALQKKREVAKLAQAYDDLPWYKKALLRLK